MAPFLRSLEAGAAGKAELGDNPRALAQGVEESVAMEPVHQRHSGSRWLGRVLPRSVKPFLSSHLSSPPVGRLISLLYADRVPCYGMRFHVPTPPVLPKTKAKMWLGIYEGAEIRFVRRWLRQDLDVLELGSSLGVVAAHCARRMGSGTRLVCVEANPALVPILRMNLEEHLGEHGFVIINRAIDYDHAEVELHLSADTSASSVQRAQLQGSGIDVASVPTITLRQIISEHALVRYALVCDVEGAEAGILENDLDALAGCQQAIVELHNTERGGSPVRVEALADAFRNAGFAQRAQNGPVYVFERPW